MAHSHRHIVGYMAQTASLAYFFALFGNDEDEWLFDMRSSYRATRPQKNFVRHFIRNDRQIILPFNDDDAVNVFSHLCWSCDVLLADGLAYGR